MKDKDKDKIEGIRFCVVCQLGVIWPDEYGHRCRACVKGGRRLTDDT